MFMAPKVLLRRGWAAGWRRALTEGYEGPIVFLPGVLAAERGSWGTRAPPWAPWVPRLLQEEVNRTDTPPKQKSGFPRGPPPAKASACVASAHVVLIS